MSAGSGCENVYSVYSYLASVWMPFVAHFSGYTLHEAAVLEGASDEGAGGY